MTRRSRPPQSECRHRAARRSAWAWLVAPAHRAAVVALGGTLALVGLIVMVAVAGGTGRFTPLPLPQARDSGAGTAGAPGAGLRTSPPDPGTSSASTSPTPLPGAPTSSTSPRTAAVRSESRGSLDQQPTPSSPPSTLDTSVKSPHHGKPPWSRGGAHDDKPDVTP
ncbi:MAG TPA: hypothetical protein VFT00_05865 [Nocardioides sp.]|nr:hypothetical protein [Nocardioides sp.]